MSGERGREGAGALETGLTLQIRSGQLPRGAAMHFGFRLLNLDVRRNT
jgi:hypothetical protein